MAIHTPAKHKKAAAAPRRPASRTARRGSGPAAPSAAVVPKVDRRAALAMVMELMAIPGPSGREGAVARYVVDKLRQAGAPAEAIRFDNAHRKTPLAGEVGNLILQLPGTRRDGRRLLMAHMDTVPICVGSRPVRKGAVVRSADPHTGLGADDRSGVAVVLGAALAILRAGLPHPPLTFLFAVQEEVGLHGARYVQLGQLGKPKLAFNWDGGPAEKVTIGATGGYRLQIEVTGLAAHAGAAPEQGISAIAVASLAIANLVREGWHGLVVKGEQRGTSNVGFIRGGEATNVVTDRVELKAEARSHDRRFRERIKGEIERAFVEAAAQVRNDAGRAGQVRFQGRLDYEAFQLRRDEPVVVAAEKAVRGAGLEPQLSISNGGLDANWMTAHGIPTVTLGCGQSQIHTTSETLDIAAYEQACEIALRLALGIE